MKKLFHYFALLALCLFLSPAIQSQTLSYSRTTAGFTTPTFEGGRTDFAFSDINDNGRVDILSIGDHGNPLINSTQQGLLIWFNNGDGTFTSFMTGYFGYGGIAVGDVNNDGFKDIGFGQHHNYSSTGFGDQLIEVALGDGTGMNWTPWDVGLATNGETWGMFGTDFGDVNNNGFLDLVSISFGCCAGFHVYLNQTDGSWTPSFGMLENNSDMNIYFCDINNDGYLDFVAGHALGVAFFGDGTGNFINNDTGLPSSGGSNYPFGISVGDINNNGAFGLSYVNTSGGLEVYEWNDILNTWASYSGNLPASGDYQMTQLYDMNSDGFTDLVAYGKGTGQVWLGDGDGNWTPDATFHSDETPGHARALDVGGDLTRNGFSDIIVLSNEGNFWWNYNNELYVFIEESEPDSMWIRPLYPRGHENFYPGSVRFIEWASAVPGNATTTVKIEISAFGPNGPWWLVADNLPNNGKHQWTVPNYASEECYLKLTVSSQEGSATAVTSHQFQIIGEPTGKTTPRPEETITVFPNPGDDEVFINSKEQITGIVFFDIHGMEALKMSNPQSTINTSGLVAGIYFWEASTISGKTIRGKWIRR